VLALVKACPIRCATQRSRCAPAAHVAAARQALPSVHGLSVLILDATGMRVGEPEGLRWRDVDERAGWSSTCAKAGHAAGCRYHSSCVTL